jgi:glycerol-3-phosphate dehydrogenase
MLDESVTSRSDLDARGRRRQFWNTTHEPLDVVVVGGGVQGACLYARLVREGRRVLLIDQKDFGSGTSQASAMLVWGGLLYLSNAEFLHVIRLSASRDHLLGRHSELAEPHYLSYVFGRRQHRQPWFVHAGLWTYWLLGGCRRSVPRGSSVFPEQSFLVEDSAVRRLRFEEGHLRLSDAQLAFHWISTSRAGGAANYCSLIGGGFDSQQRLWRLELRDTLHGNEIEICAKWVVNAAGVWTDRVNAKFGVDSRWQHLLAKGASFSFARPEGHRDTLVFDSDDNGEGLSLVPWGPVSLWGSTETMTQSADEGWHVEPGDVEYLLSQLNSRMRSAVRPHDIISLRCGVRSLAVPRGTTRGNPRDLSKRWCVHFDEHRPWVSIYGGKITACISVAARVARLLGRALGAPGDTFPAVFLDDPETEHFPGLEARVPAARWSRDHQMCCTLDDYLRRRTNIAQWTLRGGLGRSGEHRGALVRIATVLCYGDDTAAAAMVDEYERRVVREHDAVLGTSPVSVIQDG